MDYVHIVAQRKSREGDGLFRQKIVKYLFCLTLKGHTSGTHLNSHTSANWDFANFKPLYFPYFLTKT